MRFLILGDDFQSLEIGLDPGESIKAHHGAMLYMDEGIGMNTKVDGGMVQGLSRKISGEHFFLTSYKNQSRDGTKHVGLTSHRPGKVIQIDFSDVQGQSIICQKETFLCATDDVKVSMMFNKRIGSTLFGGEGFILQRYSGGPEDTAFITAIGNVVSRQMKMGDVLYVEKGAIVAFEETIDFSIHYVRGFTNRYLGGEGMFLCKLTCIGNAGGVILQSVSLGRGGSRIGRKRGLASANVE